MAASSAERTLPIRSQDDVVRVRQAVRSLASELGFSFVDLTKLVTAASELARNTLVHGGGGEATITPVGNAAREGLSILFTDRGPGIADVEKALQDGYSTGSGLGLGLGGSRRLVNEFNLDSRPGEGTRVRITKWK